MSGFNKGLVAYYSRKGQNYAGGSIVNLSVGNTEVIAKKIQVLTGYDLFKIETKKQYPIDYMEITRVAKRELDAEARPELTETVYNMDEYDIIYLGYPNWWGTFPMAVATFLESYDFSGKTIVPFCTHEGSGMCGLNDIQLLSPKAIVAKGLAIKGSSVHGADDMVKSWIEKMK